MDHALILPYGTKEFVVFVLTRAPDGIDATSLSSEMAVTAVDVDPVEGDWENAQWVPDMAGYGKIVDTEALGRGEYDVRVRVTYDQETPLLGPARLRVT